MTTAARLLGQGLTGETSGVKDAARAADVETAVADDAAGAQTDPVVGRFHNRENPSPAEMAEMLREVQDSLAVLDERLAGLEGAQGESSLMTRRLASSVAELGQTLARRVRSLETGEAAPRPIEPPVEPPAEPAPAPSRTPPPTVFAAAPASRPVAARWLRTGRVDTLVLILGLAALLVLIAIGLWVFGWPHAAAGSSARAAAPPATAPAAAPLSGAPTDASAPSSVQRTASPPSTAAPRRHIVHPVRHTAARQVPAAAPAAAAPVAAAPAAVAAPPTGFRSFGPAATDSAQKPSS